MRKSKRTQPRHLQIQFDICKQAVQFEFKPQNKRHSVNIPSTPNKQIRYLTKASNKENEAQDAELGIIRLRSKKKTVKTEPKEEIQTAKKQALTSKQPDNRSNSKLNKYFQSARAYKYLDLTKQKNQPEIETQTINPETSSKLKTDNKSSMTKLNANSISKQSRQRRGSNNKLKTGQQKVVNRDNKSLSSFSIDKSEQKSKELISLHKKLKSPQEHTKMQSRIQKIKHFKFVEQYLSDLQLEGIFNELIIADIPQARWSLIIVDKIYQLIRRKEFNDPASEIIRKF